MGCAMTDWNRLIVHPITGQRTPAYLNGVIAPMFTACNEDHSLDEAGIRSYTEYLIGTGAVTALFPRSGMGRMYSFTFDEIQQIIDIVTDQAKGRVAVVPGCAGACDWRSRPDGETYTRQTIQLCHHAAERGASAAFIVVPYALIEDQRTEVADPVVLDYYRRVASGSDLPIIIYQPPSGPRGFRVRQPLFRQLLEVPGIVGMKYSTGQFERYAELALYAQERDFALMAGDEIMLMPVFTLGGCGVVGQGCTMNPEILRAAYERLMSSDYAGASRATMDMYRALEAQNDLDPAMAGLQYMAMKGASIQPYTKTPENIIPTDRMADVARRIDALREPYRDNSWWRPVAE